MVLHVEEQFEPARRDLRACRRSRCKVDRNFWVHSYVRARERESERERERERPKG